VVEEVDHKRREVYCTLVKGNIPAYFGDVAGDIHTRILERMQQVLREDTHYPYLMPHAVCRLADARETFRRIREAGLLNPSECDGEIQMINSSDDKRLVELSWELLERGVGRKLR
jgi:hypothetical protein